MILNELLKVIANSEIVNVSIEGRRYISNPYCIRKNLLSSADLKRQVIVFFVSSDNTINIVLK